MTAKSIAEPKCRILIVDDRVGLTNLWHLMLENSGAYSVREENDSSLALAAARNFRPHLILLDIDMPGTDGPQVARLVRADAELTDTPIIFLSALISDEEAAAGKRVEGHPCLPKPTYELTLVQKIEEVLTAARRTKSARATRTRLIRAPKRLCLDAVLS